MLDGFCKNGHFEEALAFFQELEMKSVDLYCAIYGIIITGLCRKGKLDIACDIFNECQGLHLNVRFYFTMINGLCQEGLLNKTKDLMRKMEQNGYPPNSLTYDVILGYMNFL